MLHCYTRMTKDGQWNKTFSLSINLGGGGQVTRLCQQTKAFKVKVQLKWTQT